MKTLFTHISKLYTGKPVAISGPDMAQVSTLEDAFMLVEDGWIRSIGPMSNAPKAEREISIENKEVMPGFIDSHTHTVFAASREEEFVMRIKGATYEEIAEAGGGILNSARKMALATEDALFEAALIRVRDMILLGTTTLEIKSGYGLSVDSELKMLRVIKRLKAALPIQIKATFLGAHAFPLEYRNNQDAYISLIIEHMLPVIAAEKLADHVDVFCEKGFFSPEQASRVIKAAQKWGLPAKIHGNQLGLSGGVQVAVAHESWSVDHLEFTEGSEWELLKSSLQKPYGGTIPVALPGVSFFLGLPYTRGREMINFGLPLALATDFNPGSSPINSLQMVMSLACTQMKLTPEEAFHAVTLNAAAALRMSDRVGCLAEGMQADFLVMKHANALSKIPYFVGQNQVESVYVLGEKFD